MLERAAVSDVPGVITLKINSRNPTVSTVSDAFIHAAGGAGGWEGQAWDDRVTVPATTLDALIAKHGVPAFVKIDVEGYEAQVLAGLSHPVPALSFEFTTIQRDVALRCLKRMTMLGPYTFNVALGESQTLHFDIPVSKEVMIEYISSLPHHANSGDVYAVLCR
jgi:hypothetical protein